MYSGGGVPARLSGRECSQCFIALGDFNTDRKDDPLGQAFTSIGLTAPAALNKVPRTLFPDPARPEADAFHDQIAWFRTTKGKCRVAALEARKRSWCRFVAVWAALYCLNPDPRLQVIPEWRLYAPRTGFWCRQSHRALTRTR